MAHSLHRILSAQNGKIELPGGRVFPPRSKNVGLDLKGNIARSKKGSSQDLTAIKSNNPPLFAILGGIIRYTVSINFFYFFKMIFIFLTKFLNIISGEYIHINLSPRFTPHAKI